MLKRSKGFNWGPGALSTSVWKGVLVKDVLDYVGIVDDMSATYVWFSSCDDLHHGPYGTCLPFCRINDIAYDVMLAYEMNGEPLTPDHGYPVRLIVPGYIGGRMVKWVSEIHVSADLIPNWHHYYDNRFLPPYIDSDEKAEAGGFWKDERFALYQMNINSVIVKPDAGEIIELFDAMKRKGPLTSAAMLTAVTGDEFSGWKYAVMHSGHDWELADIYYPDGIPLSWFDHSSPLLDHVPLDKNNTDLAPDWS